MPRLTKHDYIERRQSLQENWKAYPDELFEQIPKKDYDTLVYYYQFKLDLDDSSAEEWRRDVTTASPSLPNRAGKAWKRLAKALEVHRVKRQPDTRRISGNVRVTGHQPTALSDKEALRRVALACISIAKRQLEEERRAK